MDRMTSTFRVFLVKPSTMDSQPHPERCFDSIYCIIHGFNDQEEITVMMVACGDASDII